MACLVPHRMLKFVISTHLFNTIITIFPTHQSKEHSQRFSCFCPRFTSPGQEPHFSSIKQHYMNYVYKSELQKILVNVPTSCVVANGIHHSPSTPKDTSNSSHYRVVQTTHQQQHQELWVVLQSVPYHSRDGRRNTEIKHHLRERERLVK